MNLRPIGEVEADRTPQATTWSSSYSDSESVEDQGRLDAMRGVSRLQRRLGHDVDGQSTGLLGCQMSDTSHRTGLMATVVITAMATLWLANNPSAVVATRFFSVPEPRSTRSPNGYIGPEGGTFNGAAPKLVVDVSRGFLPNGAIFFAFPTDLIPAGTQDANGTRLIGQPHCFSIWVNGQMPEQYHAPLRIVRSLAEISPSPSLSNHEQSMLRLAFFDDREQAWSVIGGQDMSRRGSWHIEATLTHLVLSRRCDPSKPQVLLGVVLESGSPAFDVVSLTTSQRAGSSPPQQPLAAATSGPLPAYRPGNRAGGARAAILFE